MKKELMDQAKQEMERARKALRAAEILAKVGYTQRKAFGD